MSAGVSFISPSHDDPPRLLAKGIGVVPEERNDPPHPEHDQRQDDEEGDVEGEVAQAGRQPPASPGSQPGE